MKTTFLRTALLLLVLLPCLTLRADGPEDGKIYQLVSRYYPTLAATEDFSINGVVTRTKGDNTAYEQMWRFDAKDNGFTLTNVLTGNAITDYGGSNNQYWTGSKDNAHTFVLASPAAGYWNVRHASNKGGLHAAWTGKVVYWHDNSAEATQWQLVEMTGLSEEQLSLKQMVYRNYVDLTTHEAEYNTALKTFFTDESCSELLPAYAAMSDDALRTAMQALPTTFADIAVKVKNDAWAHREKEFRIRDYSAYSNPDYWCDILLTNRWGRINNPTGIYGNKGDILLVFVGDDIPAGATLQMEFILGTDLQGSAVDLHKGLNVLTVADNQSMCYIQYVGTTTPDDSKLITDYPPLRIHIENGVVNGFWNMTEHTDADWVDILNNATAPAIDVKGEKVMFHMHTSVMRKNCPTSIHNAIDWWEDMLRWQHDIMGIEEYVPQKCNNMACAITLDDDHTYMAATSYRTQYHVNVAYKILDFNTVITDPDYCFGPAHENGHMNQGAINIVGCTESSNGILENLIVWKIGKYLTRGPVNATMWNEYAQEIPWPKRANDDMLRLQWQLYLYFHECGVDTTFWPRVFKAMRSTPLPIRYGNKKEVSAREDMLLFAKHCCDVAQMDLTDFFRVYDFLVPHGKMETRESGNYLITPQKDIDEFIAYASRYPKAPPIEFIDDRIKPVPRTDGGSGSKQTYDYGVGQCGDVGQYTDFLATDVHAEGYIYSRTGNNITIKNGTGAVGFRFYDKDSGRLVFLSNSLKPTLPAPCQNIRLRLVAVSADGTETDIPSTAEAGTEEEQLAALKNSLNSAKSVLDLRDDEGITVGYYFGYALNDLQAIYDSALRARDNKDQTEHTYGQWAMLLDEAAYSVTSDDEARVPIFPENLYALYLTVYKSYSLLYFSSGPKGSVSDPQYDTLKQWQFEPTSMPGHYRIRNAGNGLYITTLEATKRARMLSDDPYDALTFTLEYGTKGTVNIVESTTGLYLAYNGNKEAVGSTNASQWRLTAVDDQHSQAVIARLAFYEQLAECMYNDLKVDDILVLSDNYEAARAQFLDAYQTVIDIECYRKNGRLDLRLDDLWDAMEALSPTFINPHSIDRWIVPYEEKYPDLDESFYFYLQNLKTGAYAYYNDQTGRYEGCVRMGPLAQTEDPRFLFRLERDKEGNIYLRNLFSGCVAALWNSYIDCSGSRTPEPFALSLDSEAGGYLISGEGGYWTTQSGTASAVYAQYRTNGTPWKFRMGYYFKKSGIDPVQSYPTDGHTVFDLFGRPATPTQPGILIIDGKKTLVK